MNHTASKDFKPAGFLTYGATLTSAELATDIHFRTWLSERKITGTEPNLHIIAIHFLHKEIKRLFQIRERNVFIDIQSFNLVKETMRSRAHSFVSIYAARADNTQW